MSSAAAEIDTLDWALAYARAGWAVVPVWPRAEDGAGGWRCACPKGAECDRPAKHPIPKQGVKQATTDEVRLRAWWDEHPDANIAIATGEISKCIVIDVDTADGKGGDVAITTACAPHGGVPRTLTARSGSGGAHYFYRFRKNPFTRKIGFLKHVDYLSDGGYVIVQPSTNLKGGYVWGDEAGVRAPEDVGQLRNELAELPEWFDELEGTGRAGKKEKSESRAAAQRARMVNAAAMEFRATDARWVEQVRLALQHVDPDSRDDWVLFGIILGREFERNDDGWALYSEWASRSAKYADKGTDKAMRAYYYEESLHDPQGGSPATIATVFRRAQEGGWALPAGGVDDRPVVAYREGRAVETANTLMTLLARERESDSDMPLRIYAFGSGLGAVVESHDFSAKYVNGRPPHGWVLKVLPHTPMSIGSRVTHTATLVQFTASGSTRQVECPREVSTLMLTEYTKHFPRLNGIVQWPMVVGGRLAGADAPYDEVAGLYFSLPEGMDLSTIPAAPTKKDAEAARRWLMDVALADFPFASERDAAAALAMMLTFVQRRHMKTAPAFMVTAPIQGSGKTALVTFASTAIHGRTLAARALSWVAEEQRKTVTATLMENPPAVLYDNLPAGSTFDSAELAIALTSSDWEDRKLGVSEAVRVPNRAVWCFTGNNITLRADLRRRFVVVRMKPKQSAHYEQIFPRELESWAIENRYEVLRALLTILLWSAKDKLTKLKSESGFKDWDREVRRAVVGLTGVDPFLTFKEQTEGETEDEEESAIAAINTAWAAAFEGGKATVAQFNEWVADAMKSSDTTKKHRAERAQAAIVTLRNKPLARIEPSDWGYAMRMLKDRPTTLEGVDVQFEVVGLRSKVAVWRLLNGELAAAKLGDEF